MSKETAMSMMTGETSPQVNPSLITGAIPTTEGEIVEPPPVDTGIDSDRFARIAAREEKFKKEREEFKLEQQRIYEEKEKLKSVQQKITEYEELKKTDPIAALKYLGYSEADLFNYMAGKEEPTPEQKYADAAAKAADEKIKTWEQQQADKAAKELAERDDQAIKGYKASIGGTIQKETEKYEYCAHYGPIAEELVYDTVLKIIKEDPELAPHQAMVEALELVENFYEQEDKAMSSLKKRQPKVEAPKEEVKPAQPARSRTVQTPVPVKSAPPLTNRAAPTAASIKTGKETPSQKRERLENWLRTGSKS